MIRFPGTVPHDQRPETRCDGDSRFGYGPHLSFRVSGKPFLSSGRPFQRTASRRAVRTSCLPPGSLGIPPVSCRLATVRRHPWSPPPSEGLPGTLRRHEARIPPGACPHAQLSTGVGSHLRPGQRVPCSRGQNVSVGLPPDAGDEPEAIPTAFLMSIFW